MANILDGIRKVEKGEIAKQLCDFQMYGIFVRLQIIWQYIYYALMYVCHRIMLLFKKEIPLPSVYSWKERYERQYESYMLLEKEALEAELIKLVRAKQRFLGLPVKSSEDGLSAEITRLVSKLYPGEEQKGLSVPEKDDYIAQNYPRRKKLDEKMCLHLWLVVSFFVLAVAVIVWASGNEFRSPIVLFCVLFELLWGYLVTCKVIQWQFAHLIHLSAEGLGQPFAGGGKGIARQVFLQDKEKNARELLVYHTLSAMKNKASEPADAALLRDLVAARETWEKDKIRRRWEKLFPKLEWKEGVFTTVTGQFAYGDYEKLEQRLLELSQAKDPAALAEKKKGKYKVPFRTMQGDIAGLYFTASRDKNKRFCVCRIERRESLKEKLLPKEKLVQLMKGEVHSVAALYQEYLHSSMPKEQKLDALRKDIHLLEQRGDEAERRCRQKEAELLKLRKQIGEREKSCEEIRDYLAKAGLSDSEYELQREKFLKIQRELTTRKSELLRCEKQWKEVSEEYDTLVSQREVLQREKTLLGQQTLELRMQFAGALRKAVSEKTNQKEVDYILGEMLIQKVVYDEKGK